jgi:carbonic anhydrase
LSELNVIEQVVNVCETTILKEAWAGGQEITVHGWIYGLSNGLLHDLGLQASRPEEIAPNRDRAVDNLRQEPV